MSHQVALVIEKQEANKVTATMMMMGRDVPLKGELVDRTITFVGVKPEGDAAHGARRLNGAANAKPIVVTLQDDGTLTGEMMTNNGPVKWTGEKLKTRKKRSRRCISHRQTSVSSGGLKGMGATIALPFLDAMIPRSPCQAPRRAQARIKLVCIEQVHGAAGSSPFGLQQNLWSPAATGRDFDLSPTSLRSLEPFRDHLTIISNTDVPSADPTEAREIGGDHLPIERRVSDAVVSQTHRRRGRGVRHLDGSAVCAAVRPGHADAVDAVVHRERRSVGRVWLRLLVRLYRRDQLVGAEQAAADDSRSAGGVRPDVQRVRVAAPHPKSAARGDRKTSASWTSCRIRRGAWPFASTPGDRARLTDYLDNIREIERRIQAVEARNGSGEPRELPGAPAGIPDSFADHVKLMIDLQMIAFRSEITRVFSFKLGRDGVEPGVSRKRIDRRVPHRVAPRREPGARPRVRAHQRVSRQQHAAVSSEADERNA